MNKLKLTKLNARVKILKALAHETRLFIIETLDIKSMSVLELTSLIGSDVSTVSKHLLVLKNAGIIKSEKKAQKIYYSLDVSCINNFLNCIESVVKENISKINKIK
jgi:DNA-binding transcriptional ArsR family regulator